MTESIPKAEGTVSEGYSRYVAHKTLVNVGALVGLAILIVVSVSVGPVSIGFGEVLGTLINASSSGRLGTIVFRIRLPQTLAAVAAGAGLAVSGLIMQTVLRNPLGSPFTLGISNAAAFGAAFSVMIIGTGTMHSTAADAITVNNPYVTTLSAFLFCLMTASVILVVARMKQGSPEVMVLTGVALGALYSAGTMLLQYFADDVQLAAMVFWTFGDLARASWGELSIIAVVATGALAYFVLQRWNYNALNAGDETAASLGVAVRQLRLIGMVIASLVTATIISFVGIIGFVGLICPHIARRLVGEDHRFLVPSSVLVGAILLVAADTLARIIMVPNVLPVAIVTAFLGAPTFIYLLIRGYRR